MTSKPYFLQRFIPEADLDFWQDFFFAEINKLARGSSVLENSSCPSIHIALKVHPISDDTNHRKASSFPSDSKILFHVQREMGVHIEFETCYANTGGRHLHTILNSEAFAALYGVKVKLCPAGYLPHLSAPTKQY
eukprot:994768-Ditylum_brightwellii.AAC.1